MRHDAGLASIELLEDPSDPRLSGLIPALVAAGLRVRHQRLEQPGDFMFAEGARATALARGYYKLAAVAKPTGLILFEPELDVELLNRIACPFLLLHERALGATQKLALLRAIKHHAYRYGDPTDHAELHAQPAGNVHTVIHWIRAATRYRHEPKHWGEMLDAAA